MRISVVTPVWNGISYIRACVRSVEAQVGCEVEHHIQDACSVDGTAEWCFSRSSTLTVSEPDSGMYDAINRGWARSKGEVLSWLNADEQYLPGTLGCVREIFEKYPGVDVVWGDALIANARGDIIAYRREPNLRSVYIKHSFLYSYSCTLFYRRHLWDSGLARLDDSYRYAADMDLVLRLLEAGCTFYRIRQPLAIYTATGANLSLSEKMERETETISRRHGGRSSTVLRSILRVARWAEKVACGGYMARSGNIRIFDRGLDDAMSARDVVFRGVGSRYSIFDEKTGLP